MNNGFYLSDETLEAQAEASRKAGVKRTKRGNSKSKVINYIKAHPNFVGTPTELAQKIDSRRKHEVYNSVRNLLSRGTIYRSSAGRTPSRWSLEPFEELGSALSPKSTHESISPIAEAPKMRAPDKPYFKFTLTDVGFKLETNERTVEVEL